MLMADSQAVGTRGVQGEGAGAQLWYLQLIYEKSLTLWHNVAHSANGGWRM